eukprot:scaffold2632_cov384-Pavlova_lutheri.AAC.2
MATIRYCIVERGIGPKGGESYQYKVGARVYEFSYRERLRLTKIFEEKQQKIGWTKGKNTLSPFYATCQATRNAVSGLSKQPRIVAYKPRIRFVLSLRSIKQYPPKVHVTIAFVVGLLLYRSASHIVNTKHRCLT